MIETNELRLGNWVSIGGISTTIWHILGDEEVEAIPMTPEVLSKCLPRPSSFGFETQFTKTGRLEIILGNCYATVADTLHEYQNLIFALTGCEIKYTP